MHAFAGKKIIHFQAACAREHDDFLDTIPFRRLPGLSLFFFFFFFF
jgi:hypothetical protein